MPHRASGSNVADFFRCAYWARHDVELLPDDTGPAAFIGRAIDDLVTAYIDGEVLSAKEAADRHAVDNIGAVERRWSHLLPWLANYIAPPFWTAQLWLVWNADIDRTRATTREALMKEGRAPLEITAVADLIARTGPDEVTVWDVKSGKVAGAKVEQLLTLAVAARRWFGVNTVRAGFVFAHEEKCFPIPSDFSQADLDAHAWRLEASMLEVPEAVPTPGAACRFCRAKECADGEAFRKQMGWRRK